MTEKLLKYHQREIKKIANRIVKKYKPEKIILFGSFAWGKPTKDSDVDLFIVKKDRGNFLEEQQKIRKIINGEIAADILVHSPSEIKNRLSLGDFFFEDIIKKGKYLYEKSAR
ncbi:MAG: nucleotidyltransferase domain-containing protein [Patescibacteria group bacterium]